MHCLWKFWKQYSPFVWSPRFLPLTNPPSRLSECPVDVEPIREELADILSSMTELANVRASTAISARSEQHTLLLLPEFLDLFNHSWNFVLKCEVICRRMIIGLRGVVVSQVCGHSRDHFHSPFLRRVGKILPPSVPPRSNITFGEAGRR